MIINEAKYCHIVTEVHPNGSYLFIYWYTEPPYWLKKELETEKTNKDLLQNVIKKPFIEILDGCCRVRGKDINGVDIDLISFSFKVYKNLIIIKQLKKGE